MNQALQRFHDIAAVAWLRLLKSLNALILLGCAGVIMLNQTNPGFINQLTNSLTKTQQAALSFGFCCLVQYALRRVGKAPQ